MCIPLYLGHTCQLDAVFESDIVRICRRYLSVTLVVVAFALLGETDEWLAVQNNAKRADDSITRAENVAFLQRDASTGRVRDTGARLEFATVSAVWGVRPRL